MSIFALFRKRINGNGASDSGTVHHNLDPSARFLPSGRVALLVLLLVIAAAVFAYRYLRTQGEEAPVAAKKPQLIGHQAQNDPNDAIIAARRLYEEKQIAQSIQTYQEALTKNPNDAQLLNDLGVLYLHDQKYAESEAYLKKSVATDPECVTCLNNLGYLKTLLGQSSEAEALLRKALGLNRDYIDPYFNLGVLYEKYGDFASSADAYREFINRSKDPSSDFNQKLKQHIDHILEK